MRLRGTLVQTASTCQWSNCDVTFLLYLFSVAQGTDAQLLNLKWFCVWDDVYISTQNMNEYKNLTLK